VIYESKWQRPKSQLPMCL